jgi:hypothetical protein
VVARLVADEAIVLHELEAGVLFREVRLGVVGGDD